MSFDLPPLRLNAFTGEDQPVTGTFGTGWIPWALDEAAGRPRADFLRPPEEAKEGDWQDARIGWGLVLPPGQALSDAATCVQDLVKERRARLGRVPVFHPFPRQDPRANTMLIDLEQDNSPVIDGSDFGVAAGSIPKYILLLGSPREISWELQETLAMSRFVGRLDLPLAGLERYIAHLMSGWDGATARRDRTLTWAVQHDSQDITKTLRSTLTRPLHRLFAGDEDIATGARFLDGRATAVTAEDLRDGLASHQPIMVATSSHGQTGPLHDPAAMAANLGLLVGHDTVLLDPADLLRHWQPAGAIWFAHACCSAGSRSKSAFDGLFDLADPIGEVLAAVAALGDRTAPLPTALLGAEQPLRAFIGQVEPTFDWTLVQPETGQRLTALLVKPLYERIFGEKPVAMSLQPWHGRAATLNRNWQEMVRAIRDGSRALAPEILYPRLAAADVTSTVLLGDPTAALPRTP
ncbi:MAG: hypothetical protein AAF604_00830 [Acidobacteriota bacterium]